MIRIRKPIFSILHFAIVLFALSLFFSNLMQQYSFIKEVPIVELTTESLSTYVYEKKYDFSTDWFSQHVPIWRKALERFKGKPDLAYLEVGVFEGRAVFWMFENILTNQSSHATVIDLFQGEYQGMYPDFAKRYFENEQKSGLGERLKTVKGYSQVELRKFNLNSFDIIYIDGSHENRDVLEDAILTHRLLKPGGILIFDDYGRKNRDFNAPRLGIDVFYSYFKDQFKVLHNDHQIILEKK